MKWLGRRSLMQRAGPTANLPLSNNVQQRRTVHSSIIRTPGGVPLRSNARDEAGAEDVDALTPAAPSRVTVNILIASVTTPHIATAGHIIPSTITLISTPASAIAGSSEPPRTAIIIGAPPINVRQTTAIIIAASGITISVTTIVTATTMTPARVITPVSVIILGWLLSSPLPLDASSGVGPVAVAVAYGNVNVPAPTSDGGSGVGGA